MLQEKEQASWSYFIRGFKRVANPTCRVLLLTRGPVHHAERRRDEMGWTDFRTESCFFFNDGERITHRFSCYGSEWHFALLDFKQWSITQEIDHEKCMEQITHHLDRNGSPTGSAATAREKTPCHFALLDFKQWSITQEIDHEKYMEQITHHLDRIFANTHRQTVRLRRNEGLAFIYI